MAVKNARQLDHLVAAWQPIRENTYGSVRRLDWIRSHLAPGARILEVGCGTGYMITMPLIAAGYDARGLDLDALGIEYGQRIAQLSGFDPSRLAVRDLAELDEDFDVVILSEVLEHQTSDGCRQLLDLVMQRLAPEGALLVTVPNGRGWFEREASVWRRGGGRVASALRLGWVAFQCKRWLIGPYVDAAFPSAVDSSPHLQQFSLGSITALLRERGFVVSSATGTVMFAGPFSNMVITGITPLMRLNAWLGARFPARASGFMVAARAPRPTS